MDTSFVLVEVIMSFPFGRYRLSTSKPRLLDAPRKLSLEFLEHRLNPGVIAFSQAAYEIANNAGAVTIGLVRTGDTRTTDTANLLSTNGTAAAPTDFNAVNGTITFVPSATQVPFQIIIHQNSQPGDRSFTLDLASPSSNASLGTIVHATVTIVDVTSHNARFVSQLYQTVLNRAADLNGLTFYTSQLDNGTVTRQTVALGFLTSAANIERCKLTSSISRFLAALADPRWGDFCTEQAS